MTAPAAESRARQDSARSASRAFVVLATSFGVAFLLVTPPYQAPDEYKHFYRAFQVTDGQLGAERLQGQVGGALPASLVASVEGLSRGLAFHPEVKQRPEQIAAELERPLAAHSRVFVRFAGLPGPLGYLPQAAGIAVARAFEAPPVALVWSGRLVNLLAYVAVVALSIRCTPVQPWTWTFLALTPMALFQAASLSADAATNAAGFLFLARCLRHAAPGSGPMTRRDLGVLAGLLAFLGLSKPAYAPLALAALLVPASRFGARARQVVALGALAVAAVAPALGWMAYTRALGAAELAPGADPTAQLHFVLLHPFSFAAVVARTIVDTGLGWLLSFVGVLGWLDVFLPAPVYALALAALVALALVEGPASLGAPRRERIVALATAGGCFLAILTLSYVGWNPPRSELVRGVQGRYFVPLAPLVALALRSRRLAVSPALLDVRLAAVPAILLLASTLALLRRYWPV